MCTVQNGTNKEMNKIKSLRANIPELEKTELDRIAQIIDVPAAQIIREGVREKVQKLKRTHPKLKQEFAEVPA